MKHKMISTMAIFLISILSASYASPYSLNSLIIEGVDSNQNRALREAIAPTLKNTFNIDDLNNAVGAAYQVGQFNGIEVYLEDVGENTNVIMKITLIRNIRRLIFKGNASFSTSDFSNEITLHEGDGFGTDKVKLAVESLKKFYNLSGFLNAQVSADFVMPPNTSNIDVIITINEGAPCLISKITIESINQNLNKDLQNFTSRQLNKAFTQTLLSQIQNDASEYLFNEQYYSANLQAPEVILNDSKTQVSLRYVIADPYSYALTFEGNEQFTVERIKKEIKLDSNNRLSTSPTEDLVERITRFYRSKGYANVSVKAQQNLVAADMKRRIDFLIKEGGKVRISDFVFDGKFSRPSKYYRNFILDHSGDLVGSHTFNSDELETGVKNLVTDLQNQGFIAAKVTSTRVDFDKNRESVVVKVTIDEGPQTFIDKINFKGVTHVTTKSLEQVIGLSSGGPLQLKLLEEAAARIVEVYRNHGYLDARILNNEKTMIKYSTDNTRASLTFELYEGPQITVGAVIIEGNTFTKDYVIRRELQFKVGEILTPEKLSYSEQRLQRLSIFHSIDIRALEDDPEQGNRTILVQVAERDPGLFQTGVGVNNELSLSIKGFMGAKYRNLFGTGRGVNGRIEVNEKVQYTFTEYDLNLGYTEPFIFDTSNTARINLTRSIKIFSIDAQQGQTLALDKSQGDIYFDRDITRKLKLIYDVYGIAHTNTFEIYNKIPSQPLDIATTGPTLIYDRRNDVFNPSRGDITSLSFEYSTPLMGSTSTVNYYKTYGSYTRYISFGPFVLANEASGGYLKNISTLQNGAVPQIKSFILGGHSTIRGFDPIAESIPLLSDFPNGIAQDSFFLLGKSELRFPLVGALGAAIFYDGGRVAFAGFNPHYPWRDSVGIGLRYSTPVGPVSLEYGYKLNRDDTRNESAGQIHFSIGVF